MISYKTVQTSASVADKVYCDICGQEIMRNVSGEFDDYVHIEKNWGYHSKKDGTTSTIDLCEECFDRLFAKGIQDSRNSG